MSTTVDMIGVRHGRLTGLSNEGGGYWGFKCDCGNVIIAGGRSVRTGNTNSCGCLHSEISAEGARQRFTVHGGVGTLTRTKWDSMWARVAYDENYVNRIFVCDRWTVFANFLADMGECPAGLTLERVDNDGDYTPENCKWATTAEQNWNRGGTGKYRRAVLRHEDNDCVIINVQPFWDYLIERESIRLRRAAGLPESEWTSDEIFKSFSFTNAKRDNDRTTVLFRREFYDPHGDDDQKILLLNAAIFRYFGCIDMIRAVGWSSNWSPERRQQIMDIAEVRTAIGEKVFTGAYIIPAMGRSEVKYSLVLEIIDGLWNQFGEVLKYDRWEQWTNLLSGCYGCGSFMAKEILLDFILASSRTPLDWETWTPVGPGARLGAGWIRDGVFDRLREADALKVIRSVYETRDEFWPEEFVRLSLTDIQFAFCEVAKYQKAVTGCGRPKKKFKPTVDSVTKGAK